MYHYLVLFCIFAISKCSKAYEKYIKWGGIVLASPFILFILLCILIYIPPVQNFIVDKATAYASEATGMQIHIQRISLSFPLNLVVHETTVKTRKRLCWT